MATKYYVWTPISTGEKNIKPGEVVSEKDFPDDWDQLVAAGAIRTREYPKMPDTWKGSPRDYRLAQLKRLQDDLDSDEMDELDDLVAEENE